MITIETLLRSNLVQLVATFASGMGLYIIFLRYENIIFTLVGYLLSFGIFFSFLFNVGEVYPYGDFYKRAFFIFGDNVTTIIILYFCFAILFGNNILSILLAASTILSGGKISFVLLFIMMFAINLLNKKNAHSINKKFFRLIAIGLLIYAAMLYASGVAEHSGLAKTVRTTISHIILSEDALLRGASACMTKSRCF